MCTQTVPEARNQTSTELGDVSAAPQPWISLNTHWLLHGIISSRNNVSPLIESEQTSVYEPTFPPNKLENGKVHSSRNERGSEKERAQIVIYFKTAPSWRKTHPENWVSTDPESLLSDGGGGAAVCRNHGRADRSIIHQRPHEGGWAWLKSGGPTESGGKEPTNNRCYIN